MAGAGTQGSHGEMRTFGNEIMTGGSSCGPLHTPLTHGHTRQARSTKPQ